MHRKTCFVPLKNHCMFLTVVVWILMIVALVSGCTSKQKVLMPPRIDLAAYNNIGIIEFSSNGEAWVKNQVTQNFVQRIQSAQPDVRFLELGSVEALLLSIGATRLDPAAIKVLSEKFHVKAIFTGHLEISCVKPAVRWNPAANTAKAQAYVEGHLTAKLMEGVSGATLWTLASRAKKSVGAIKIDRNGPIGIKVGDPESAYGQLIGTLAYETTKDFYPYYVYQSASK